MIRRATGLAVALAALALSGCASSSGPSSTRQRLAVQIRELGVDPDNGIGDVYEKIRELPDAERQEIEAAIAAVYERGPALAGGA